MPYDTLMAFVSTLLKKTSDIRKQIQSKRCSQHGLLLNKFYDLHQYSVGRADISLIGISWATSFKYKSSQQKKYVFVFMAL